MALGGAAGILRMRSMRRDVETTTLYNLNLFIYDKEPNLDRNLSNITLRSELPLWLSGRGVGIVQQNQKALQIKI